MAEINANTQETDDVWKDADFLSFDDSSDNAPLTKDNNHEREESTVTVLGKYASPQGMDRPLHPDTSNGNGVLEVDSFPPWMMLDVDNGLPSQVYTRKPRLIDLHNEIIQFYNLMQPQEDELNERLTLVEEIRQIVYKEFGGKDKVQVETFGSLATGLFLPSSDIDIVIHFLDDEDENNENNAETTDSQEDWEKHILKGSGNRMERFANALRRAWLQGEKITYLEVIQATRVPLVKFTHSPTNINVDVSFERLSGRENATYMNDMLKRIPCLKPLIFVLKAYLSARSLNEPFSGGVGSFLLQLMIISFLQHRCREEINRGNQISRTVQNLGSMLLEFFELYGIDYNYCLVGISVRNGGYYFPKGAKERRDNFWQEAKPFMLAVENPNDPTGNVGTSSYRISLVQRAFESSFKVLLAHVSDPPEPSKSILATIIPPTVEMTERVAKIRSKRKMATSKKRSASDDHTISRSKQLQSDKYQLNVYDRDSKYQQYDRENKRRKGSFRR